MYAETQKDSPRLVREMRPFYVRVRKNLRFWKFHIFWRTQNNHYVGRLLLPKQHVEHISCLKHARPLILTNQLWELEKSRCDDENHS